VTRFLILLSTLLLAIADSASAGDAAETPPATQPNADAVVAADGSGQYSSVQDALFKAPQTPTREKPWTILIKPGTYKELIYAQREKRFVHLVGQDARTTLITFNVAPKMLGFDGKPIGTFRTPTAVIDADDFTVENLTIENSAGKVGPALALRVDGDRDTFNDCRFLGFQDTLFLNRGRQYFKDCSITGATDFIFGGATAYFEKCHIHCRNDGYITAASTSDTAPFGFVFSNCTIDGEAGVKTYLGRPWRAFSSVTFLNTEMSAVVRPVGWNNWSDPAREKTSRYAEFNSTGPGAKPTERPGWSKQLSSEEAQKITVEAVLGGSDQWEPATR
jgi:pectinesterase